MKERASWPMQDWEVRAILSGKKTQTRRLVKLPRGFSWYEELGGERDGWWKDRAHPQGWWQ